MNDRWLDRSNSYSDRIEHEAASRASEAAAFFGADMVNARLEEARRMGEQQAIEVASQLAGEASHMRQMQHINQYHASPIDRLPVHPQTLEEEVKIAALRAERGREAAARHAEQTRQTAQRLEEERERLAKQQLELDHRTRQRLALSMKREDNTIPPIQNWLGCLCWCIVSAVMFWFSMSLAILLVSGTMSGGYSWMPIVTGMLAVTIPIIMLTRHPIYISVMWIGAIPVLLSAIHHVDNISFVRLVILLTTITGALFCAFMSNAVISMTYGREARRKNWILKSNPRCDYCGSIPSTRTRSIPSKFGATSITVVACSAHEQGTLWTRELEEQLLDSMD